MDTIGMAAFVAAQKQQAEIDNLDERISSIGSSDGTPAADVGDLVMVFEGALK